MDKSASILAVPDQIQLYEAVINLVNPISTGQFLIHPGPKIQQSLGENSNFYIYIYIYIYIYLFLFFCFFLYTLVFGQMFIKNS